MNSLKEWQIFAIHYYILEALKDEHLWLDDISYSNQEKELIDKTSELLEHIKKVIELE